MKIGITGSLASGKSSSIKILSKGVFPVFSADKEVKKLYKSQKFKASISKKLKIKNKHDLKKIIKKLVIEKKLPLKLLEKIIHPYVRKKMRVFILKNKRKKFSICEIPLLVESNLMKYFDLIVFISAHKHVRLKRYLKAGGKKEAFIFLEKRQMSRQKKTKFCDIEVANNSTIQVLKKKLLNIMKLYE